jgi:hypothetical protein
MRYLRQGPDDGPTCWLFALCNAARFFNLGTPIPGSDQWDELRDVGAFIPHQQLKLDDVAEHLGLRLAAIYDEPLWRRLPVIVTVHAPGAIQPTLGLREYFFHFTLAIGGTKDALTFINYNREYGPIAHVVATEHVHLTSSDDKIPHAWTVRPR